MSDIGRENVVRQAREEYLAFMAKKKEKAEKERNCLHEGVAMKYGYTSKLDNGLKTIFGYHCHCRECGWYGFVSDEEFGNVR